jgi:hypothetical protein
LKLQDGSNVVATGSGVIDLTGLTFSQTVPSATGVIPELGEAAAGGTVDIYTGFTGPSNFGTGPGAIATSGSGDEVGIYADLGELGVPTGYVSNTFLSDTMTFDNATFASLGLTPAHTCSLGAIKVLSQSGHSAAGDLDDVDGRLRRPWLLCLSRIEEKHWRSRVGLIEHAVVFRRDGREAVFSFVLMLQRVRRLMALSGRAGWR